MNVALDAATIFEKMLSLHTSPLPPPDPDHTHRYYRCREHPSGKVYRMMCDKVTFKDVHDLPTWQQQRGAIHRIWPEAMDTPILAFRLSKIVTRDTLAR